MQVVTLVCCYIVVGNVQYMNYSVCCRHIFLWSGNYQMLQYVVRWGAWLRGRGMTNFGIAIVLRLLICRMQTDSSESFRSILI